MQKSDSGFRGEINVVSPGDSAKLASPGRRAGFSHVNKREVKSSPLTRASPTKRAGPPPCKQPSSYITKASVCHCPSCQPRPCGI